MGQIEVDIDEYVTLLKESHSREVARLEAEHKNCYLYYTYCQKSSCDGRVKFGSGSSKAECDKCGTLYELVIEG